MEYSDSKNQMFINGLRLIDKQNRRYFDKIGSLEHWYKVENINGKASLSYLKEDIREAIDKEVFNLFHTIFRK